MTTKRKKLFPLTFRTKQDLDDALSIYDDRGEGDMMRFLKAQGARTPADQLDLWLIKENVEVCPQGQKKLLGAAGQVSSWKAYIRKHWDDGDGVQHWFYDNFSFDGVYAYWSLQRLSGSKAAASLRNTRSWPFRKVAKRAKTRR